MHLRATVLSVAAAAAVLAFSTGCTHTANAQAALTQAEAEKVSSNIYIANCHPPQPGLTRTVALGKPNPNGRVREIYGPTLVYPVQVTWTGTCSGHPANDNQTDFFTDVDAKYTANYYRDQFGNWTHTPFVGVCKWIHASYQPNGSPKIPVPGAHLEGCNIADTIND